MKNAEKYKAAPEPDYSERTWPEKQIEKAPIWCSVDLRDGNQALEEAMKIPEKAELFRLLVDIGFKQIEVGYPASSTVEYDFLRYLAEEQLVPDDVTPQVMIPCRPEFIERTFSAIEGLKRCIIHVYNPVSELQREIVFGRSREEIKQMAVDTVEKVRRRALSFDGELTLEYSPESFMETDREYVLEICSAVIDAWGPDEKSPVIINLPSTVERTTPNIYADRVEWIGRHLPGRECVVLSIHPHNDRGTGVAAAELGLMAGAERVEGTLFGNGERAGNLDLITLAYNLYSRGVDPGLDLSDITRIVRTYEQYVGLTVPMRQPYAGALAFTSFSGAHQDAIRKGLHHMDEKGGGHWEVPYLPIDPGDIGLERSVLVRINSQSGKGGVAFVMEDAFGYYMPRRLRQEMGDIIKPIAAEKGSLSAEDIMDIFRKNYIEPEGPFSLRNRQITELGKDTRIQLTFSYNDKVYMAEALGKGPLEAAEAAVGSVFPMNVRMITFSSHALNTGSDSEVVAYVLMRDQDTGLESYGVGLSHSVTGATVKGFFSWLNRRERMLKR